MNADQVTSAVCERLADRLFKSVDAEAARIAAEVRERVSKPVGRSGSKVIRSKPGEDPRREYGNYQKSWTHRTTRIGDRIEGRAGSTSKIGNMLENGTSKMLPRPHVSKVHSQSRTESPQRIKENL